MKHVPTPPEATDWPSGAPETENGVAQPNGRASSEHRARHVLVVDDDPAMRTMIADYLTAQHMRVSTAADGREMARQLAGGVDLVVLDMKLGDENGFDLVRAVRTDSDLPIIVLTGQHRDEIDRVVGLELGADDYLTKPFSPRELLARIRAVLRRSELPARQTGQGLKRGRFRFAGWELSLRSRRLMSPSGGVVPLTNGEFALLTAFLQAPQRVLTREHLLVASRVHDNEVFDRSIDVQILRLRRKIEADSTAPQLIRTERGAGYIFCAPVGQERRIASAPVGIARRLASALAVAGALAVGAGALSFALGEPRTPVDEPIEPLPLTVDLDPAKVRLGERLFHDTRLSHGDHFACASCHQLDMGGDDDSKVRSIGADGQPLDFNTSTVFNAAESYRLNWRGNFRTLEEQAEAGLLSSSLMNTSWEEVLPKLSGDPLYPGQFAALYGGPPERENVLDALATYERSLITPNARFDRYLRGEPDAITADEERGYQLFKNNGCIACHQGINVGGNLFQKFGIFANPFAGQKAITDADLGRFSITGLDSDRHVFRVPSLRNVAITAPYFHDGRTASLEGAVKMMARNQLGRELDQHDVDLIVKFLQTLTGEYRGKLLTGDAQVVR